MLKMDKVEINLTKKQFENLNYEYSRLLCEILADFEIDLTQIPYEDTFPKLLEIFKNHGIEIKEGYE